MITDYQSEYIGLLLRQFSLQFMYSFNTKSLKEKWTMLDMESIKT